jgi:type I restriction enzyme M protein
VKILPNESFGFLRITVEQPLRLRWEITDETIQVTLDAKALQRQPEHVQALLRELLAEHRGSTFETQASVVKALGRRVADAGIATPTQKAVWSGLAVRDDQAPVIIDRKGNPEPDGDLRDQENVPLPPVAVAFEEDPGDRFASREYRTAVEDYVRDEVLPYLPDAWVDHDKTKIGYEIPLTRHFYRYVPPRPLEEIDAEIKAVEEQIQELLAEVAG